MSEYSRPECVPFSALAGKTFASIARMSEPEDGIAFIEAGSGVRYGLYHDQDCCESVDLQDICGDLQDLVGTPILAACEAYSEGVGAGNRGSETWTFYMLSTVKGSVTVRFYGESNGYYSEKVDLHLMP